MVEIMSDVELGKRPRVEGGGAKEVGLTIKAQGGG